MPSHVFEDLPFDIVKHEVWHVADLKPDADAVGWITNTGWSFKLGVQHLKLFPKVRVIVTPSTGTDHLGVPELKESGVVLCSLLDDRPGLNAIAASAEHAFLLLLNGLRRLPFATRAFDEGKWRRDMEDELRGRELQGRHVGLVGYGRIGRRVARYCEAFGAPTSYYDPYVPPGDHVSVKVDSLNQLFSQSDSIVICCTMNEETKGLIDRSVLRHLRVGATLVNIARGEIIEEVALAELIRERRDVQISLDVLAGESLGNQFRSSIVPLVDQNRILITPHIGGSTLESQTKAAIVALELVKRALGAVSVIN